MSKNSCLSFTLQSNNMPPQCFCVARKNFIFFEKKCIFLVFDRHETSKTCYDSISNKLQEGNQFFLNKREFDEFTI